MKRTFLSSYLVVGAAALSCFLMPAVTRAQSIARLNPANSFANVNSDKNASAVAALKRLEARVIVYRSLGEFEENGRLARVPLQTFESELRDVTAQLQPLVSQMPASKLKNELINALASYRDGLFWWRKIDHPRVIHVSALKFGDESSTPADVALRANVPYTVAIHWRQAAQYLHRAEALLNESNRN